MIRVLLVVDDYQELLFLQTLLKKTGFDVDGTQNPKKFEEYMLTLNPELIIATSKGKNINGLELAESIKKTNNKPFFILIVPNQMANKVRGLKFKNVDSMIDSPIDAKKMLTTIARVASLDSDQLIEKYRRIIIQLDADNESDLQVLKNQDSLRENPPSGGNSSFSSPLLSPTAENSSPKSQRLDLSPSTIEAEERAQRMQKALDSLKTPKRDGYPKQVVERFNKQIRNEESSLQLEDLDAERQAFVKALFQPQNK